MAPYDWLFNPPPTDADDVDVVEPLVIDRPNDYRWLDWLILQAARDNEYEEWMSHWRHLNEVFGIDE
jgi:hypothetical protein